MYGYLLNKAKVFYAIIPKGDVYFEKKFFINCFGKFLYGL